MANIKSAKKRVAIGKRNNNLNKFYKSRIKNLIKKYRTIIKSSESKKEASTLVVLKDLLSKIYSRIDKAEKKKVFHKRKAGRHKSRLNKVLKNFISEKDSTFS